MHITIERKAPASLWILIRRLIAILLVVITTVLFVDGLLSFTLSYASRASTPGIVHELPRLRDGLRVGKFASIIASGLLSLVFTLTYNFLEMSLALDTPSSINYEAPSQDRRQDLQSLRLGPLTTHDLGYQTWLESFARTPHVTPDEDSSTSRALSRIGGAGDGSIDGHLRDEFPWLDAEIGSAISEAAFGSVAEDEDPIQERLSDNSSSSSYWSLSQAETAAHSTTAPTLIIVLTGSNVVEYRERVINEVASWRYAPMKETIKGRLVFEYDGNGTPGPEEIDQECRKLEGWSIEGETFASQRFRVYNSPELFYHNLLKCWVYLNQHKMSGWWPRGYTPRFATAEGELPAGWVNPIDDDCRSILTETTNR